MSFGDILKKTTVEAKEQIRVEKNRVKQEIIENIKTTLMKRAEKGYDNMVFFLPPQKPNTPETKRLTPSDYEEIAIFFRKEGVSAKVMSEAIRFQWT